MTSKTPEQITNDTYMFFDGFDAAGRYFFFKDYDEAKSFAGLFNGDYTYCENGYKVTL